MYRGEARRLTQALKEYDAGLLHIFFGHIGVHLLPWLRNDPLPSIVSFHGADAQVGLDQPSHRRAATEMLARATLVLARSESLVERIAALGCPREKIRVHRTGLPLDRITSTVRTPPADGAWRVVQASRLIAKKGLHTTLRAFARFASEFPAARLTIAGEGPLLDNLRQEVRDLGLGKRVHFAGFLVQSDLLKLFAEAHLFVHPSELGPDGDQEGVPNSMLEAMATGLPVLATTHGGIPEAVENGVSGILVEERDAESLAAALVEVAKSPALLGRLSTAASAAARSRFDLNAQRQVLEGYYREAIERWNKAG